MLLDKYSKEALAQTGKKASVEKKKNIEKFARISAFLSGIIVMVLLFKPMFGTKKMFFYYIKRSISLSFKIDSLFASTPYANGQYIMDRWGTNYRLTGWIVTGCVAGLIVYLSVISIFAG